MEPQNPTQNLTPKQNMHRPENKSSIGSIIGTIIIIAIIILGGLYFWGKRLEENKLKQNLVKESTTQTEEYNEAAAIKSVSSSDDLNSIQADLNSTKTENLDTEINSQTE